MGVKMGRPFFSPRTDGDHFFYIGDGTFGTALLDLDWDPRYVNKLKGTQQHNLL